MPEPPPRKFFAFQLHLSTAIVLMFVAGGLIWANCATTRMGAQFNSDIPLDERPGTDIGEFWITTVYGWPADVAERNERGEIILCSSAWQSILFGVLVLGLVGYTSESIIRRRAPA